MENKQPEITFNSAVKVAFCKQKLLIFNFLNKERYEKGIPSSIIK